MTPPDILDDIIRRLEPEDVPVEYIVMAKITDFSGDEKIIMGDQLREVMANPELHKIAEMRVILDIRKIRKAIVNEVNYIYDEVNRMFLAKNRK